MQIGLPTQRAITQRPSLPRMLPALRDLHLLPVEFVCTPDDAVLAASSSSSSPPFAAATQTQVPTPVLRPLDVAFSPAVFASRAVEAQSSAATGSSATSSPLLAQSPPQNPAEAAAIAARATMLAMSAASRQHPQMPSIAVSAQDLLRWAAEAKMANKSAAAAATSSPPHIRRKPQMVIHRRRPSSMPKSQLYCHFCGKRDTPEWRKGPAGPATLCNACGLQWAKKAKTSEDALV